MAKTTAESGQIELLVLDVDGVLTDGHILLTESGQEIKSFHARDGAGMKYWRRAGKKLAFITGRGSPVVLHRARELGVDFVRTDAKDKLPAYEQALAELGVGDAQTAVVGDDLTDIPMMRRCGLAIAVADAVAETRAVADWVTQAPGGAGCVREVIEKLLKQAGLWDSILQRYLGPAGMADA
jgi:3-deoxy-D-manno-octulosonate 8-phosphate phosphatase (KDO 8-P phosphatase)